MLCNDIIYYNDDFSHRRPPNTYGNTLIAHRNMSARVCDPDKKGLRLFDNLNNVIIDWFFFFFFL